jgi:hypothetical protein
VAVQQEKARDSDGKASAANAVLTLTLSRYFASSSLFREKKKGSGL